MEKLENLNRIIGEQKVRITRLIHIERQLEILRESHDMESSDGGTTVVAKI